MFCLRSPTARRRFLQLATRRTAPATRWKSDTPPPPPPIDQEEALIHPAPSSPRHTDLASFEAYARRTGLDAASTVYVGTRYEYLVAGHLARYGFRLRRVGGARDRGTDLVGTWALPTTTTTTTTPLKVLVQCKAGRRRTGGAGPQHVRELEGALAGAPPGWRGAGEAVLAVLACERPATRGVREALGHSRWPMAYVCCEGGVGGGGGGGAVRQVLWNGRAGERCGLDGVEVGTRFRDGGEGGEELVLLRKGRVLRFGGSGEGEEGAAGPGEGI